jgi:hypothetical protein
MTAPGRRVAPPRRVGRITLQRERPPALAHIRFREQESQLRGLPLRELFTHIYRTNLWGGGESVSGVGSAVAETERLRREIAALLAMLGVTSLLDIPCGDFGWLNRADLGAVQYVGADIVEELVARNTHGGTRSPGVPSRGDAPTRSTPSVSTSVARSTFPIRPDAVASGGPT